MSVVDPCPSPRAEEAGAWCLRIAEGSQDPEQMAELEAWLATDPLNRAAFDKALFVWEAMGAEGASSALLEYRVDALQSLRDEPAPDRTTASRWRWMAAAAALALLLTAGFLFLRDATIAYETGIGERRVAMLADGSRVSLDGATRLEADFSPHRRELRLLAGRAKFDVASDPLRPFVVTAGERSVVAIGTSFTVELVGGQFRVALYEGDVRVLDGRADRAIGQPDATSPTIGRGDRGLVPGRELVFSAQSPDGAIVRISDPARSLAWETGQLSFDDEPLAMVVERINRHTTARFVVGDAAAARTRVSGVFDAGDADAFLEGVTGVFPVRAHWRGSEIVLVARDGGRNRQASVPES